MEIEYDQNKREKILLERGIDFARAGEVFAGIYFTAEDKRQNYGEVRYIKVGTLDARLIVMVWTQRKNTRRIISMRKANEREIKQFEKYLG